MIKNIEIGKVYGWQDHPNLRLKVTHSNEDYTCYIVMKVDNDFGKASTESFCRFAENIEE